MAAAVAAARGLPARCRQRAGADGCGVAPGVADRAHRPCRRARAAVSRVRSGGWRAGWAAAGRVRRPAPRSPRVIAPVAWRAAPAVGRLCPACHLCPAFRPGQVAWV